MNKRGPIVVIEDDADDRDLLAMIFKELDHPDEIAFFKYGEEALEYLKDDSILPLRHFIRHQSAQAKRVRAKKDGAYQ